MKLKTVKITCFRCIEDSTTFSLGDVTCLVGKNESGKTSVLHALERLNPLDPKTTSFDKLRDYPRHLLSDFDPDAEVLDSTWELDDADVSAVEKELGPKALNGTAINVSKNYKNAGSWILPVDEKNVVNWLLSESACNEEERAEFASLHTTAEVHAKGLVLKTQNSARITALVANIEKFRDKRATLHALDILKARMPKFLYFASYDRMLGTVHLETLAAAKANGTLDKSNEVFLAFLDYAGTTLEEIKDINTYEAIKARVEAASIKISKQIFAYWSQNRQLKVEFSVEPGRAGDVAPLNTGTVMRTRVHNKLHDMTVPFDDRSAGFTWFFSFLVMFSQVQKAHGNVIILLDEPGLNLHGKAQADLVRFIYEKLRGKHQVVYSTHSPFMVPADDFASVRTVEDVVKWSGNGEFEVFGTKVGDDTLSTDRDTLFPLQGALGYEITQSLFVGPHTLVVEGPSEILYFQAVSAELRRRKRKGLDPKWTLCPSGGIDKVAAFISLFAGNKLHVAVLTDIAQGQKNKIETLKKSKLLKDGHIFTTSDFCPQDESDVEDLFGSAVFLSLVNQAFELKGKNVLTDKALTSSGEKSVRIVKQVEAAIRLSPAMPDFDHFAPAAWLIRNPKFLEDETPEMTTALDRFDALFVALNALLPSS